MRPDRGGSQRGLCRFRHGRLKHADHGCRGESCDHRRHLNPPREGNPPHHHRAGSDRQRSECRTCRHPPETKGAPSRSPSGPGTRFLWDHEWRARRLPTGDYGCRRSALHSLYERFDRDTERGRAYLRRVHGWHVLHEQICLRPQGERHLLVYSRPRLDHRSQLHRVRSARGWRYCLLIRDDTGLPGCRHLVEDHRGAANQCLLHGTDCDPDVHEARRSLAGQV